MVPTPQLSYLNDPWCNNTGLATTARSILGELSFPLVYQTWSRSPPRLRDHLSGSDVRHRTASPSIPSVLARGSRHKSPNRLRADMWPYPVPKLARSVARASPATRTKRSTKVYNFGRPFSPVVRAPEASFSLGARTI